MGGALVADVDALGPGVERLSVAFSSPEPGSVCVENTAPVVRDCITTAANPVDVAVQTEGGLCCLTELIDRPIYFVLVLSLGC